MIEHRRSDYPELEQQRETILRYGAIEETSFRKTLASGTARLNAILDSDAVTQSGSVPGTDAADLFTTHGFPVEMTTELAAERGLAVDMAGYEAAYAAHVAASSSGEREVFVESIVPALRERGIRPTLFVGYSEPRTQAEVVALIQEGRLTDSAGEGETVQIVLDQTPFYAEAGGQVGDTGWLTQSAPSLLVPEEPSPSPTPRRTAATGSTRGRSRTASFASATGWTRRLMRDAAPASSATTRPRTCCTRRSKKSSARTSSSAAL